MSIGPPAPLPPASFLLLLLLLRLILPACTPGAAVRWRVLRMLASWCFAAWRGVVKVLNCPLLLRRGVVAAVAVAVVVVWEVEAEDEVGGVGVAVVPALASLTTVPAFLSARAALAAAIQS